MPIGEILRLTPDLKMPRNSGGCVFQVSTRELVSKVRGLTSSTTYAVPGAIPSQVLGDLAARGVKGIVLEAFGVGNM